LEYSFHRLSNNLNCVATNMQQTVFLPSYPPGSRYSPDLAKSSVLRSGVKGMFLPSSDRSEAIPRTSNQGNLMESVCKIMWAEETRLPIRLSLGTFNYYYVTRV
jgi:hypothetical protein